MVKGKSKKGKSQKLPSGNDGNLFDRLSGDESDEEISLGSDTSIRPNADNSGASTVEQPANLEQVRSMIQSSQDQIMDRITTLLSDTRAPR